MDQLTPGFLAGQLFDGLSVASILLLAALGLALSFGLMRVINMAHGELIMTGGFLMYIAQQLVPDAPIAVGLPLAFVGSALLGAVLEVSLIRWLYGRPLDTLLATWGVALILQQAARQLFEPTGVEVTAPAWLADSITIESGPFAGLAFAHVRLFIIALAIVVLVGMGLLFNKTKAGLHIRAVNQNRPMSSALGIDTRRVDLLVFALGSGVAGLAGAALALIAPVTSTVGQSYIVDAFLVVILGGMGTLRGTALAALLIGLLSAVGETFTSISFAKVLLLLFVVFFLQLRPKGLVATRSRALEEA
jgi:urea transport system permease protein